MKILVLGGTQFSGLHLVKAAVARGDEVTVVHRGVHDEGLPAGIRRVLGDRDPANAGGETPDALEAIRGLIENGERWDAVVDMCGYTPRVVKLSCDLLRDATDRYLFISTVSVYPISPDGTPTEDSELIQLDDPETEEKSAETYGGLKVLCERVVREVFADRATVLRPGLIVGPGDMTDRFTYWPRRLSQGGKVLIPSDDGFQARWIDGRDLAAFMLKCVTEGIGGTMNCCGPREPIGFGSFVRAIATGVGGSVDFVEQSESVLAGADVLPWRDLPMWTGAGGASMLRVRADRAFDAGLVSRPLEETAADTLAWDRERGMPELKAGFSLEIEADAIAKLAAQVPVE